MRVGDKKETMRSNQLEKANREINLIVIFHFSKGAELVGMSGNYGE